MEDTYRSRYLVYNEDKKILVFLDLKREGYIRLYLPSDFYIELEDIKPFTRKILNASNNTMTFLFERPTIITENKCINNKINKQDKVVIDRFYSQLNPFAEETLDVISEYASKYDLEPHFLSFEELYYLLDNMIVNATRVKNLKNAVKLLEKKLNYEIY